MSNPNSILTQSRLKELLYFDENTGIFVRLVASAQCVKVGDIAGTFRKQDGYCFVSVDGKQYRAHRLAWLYMTGEWPKKEIDHIDGNRINNSIYNLREVSRTENANNTRRPRPGNTSGYLGVTWDKVNKKWRSQIMVAGKSIKIGRFIDKNEAYEAYLAAKRKLHAGCTI
jgi:hypothetical protein